MTVLLLGHGASTHTLLVGSETTGPHRSTVESAEWSQMCTPHPAVPSALDAEPSVNWVVVRDGSEG